MCGRFLVSLCGRFSLWPFSFVAVLVVAVLVCSRFGCRPTSQSNGHQSVFFAFYIRQMAFRGMSKASDHPPPQTISRYVSDYPAALMTDFLCQAIVMSHDTWHKLEYLAVYDRASMGES